MILKNQVLKSRPPRRNAKIDLRRDTHGAVAYSALFKLADAGHGNRGRRSIRFDEVAQMKP